MLGQIEQDRIQPSSIAAFDAAQLAGRFGGAIRVNLKDMRAVGAKD
jgi:hypothetical protein